MGKVDGPYYFFSRAAHAPKMNLFINAALSRFIPRSVTNGLMAVADLVVLVTGGSCGIGQRL